ncbi:MAG TPA: sugar phosphate nucleotidyltransferase [Microvirga sp.]|jgi:mannose-1-phosphate guanylyltransferase/mannose-6-phosphate isomerase|nr:sugar phosphate nucleotidyltransferase [Microvirga sp.]
MSNLIVPVILSGGAGSRLWPASTEALPKQFLPLWDGRSLFAETLERVRSPEFAPPVIICNAGHRDHVEESLRDAGVTGAAILLEPMRRDSAAAIAVAAAYVGREHGPDAVLAVLASDHRIAPVEAFRAALREAAGRAREGYLVTFGVAPTRPATEYGYIEAGAPLGGRPGRQVLRFHEKPALPVAEGYLASGNFLWNAGIFTFSAAAFRRKAEGPMGDIMGCADAAVAAATQEGDGVLSLDRAAFERCRATSIDYALFEKAKQVAVLPSSFEWSDVGNWNSVHEALTGGSAEVYATGDVRTAQTERALVISDGIPVKVLGLENVAVVATRSGVLVVRLDLAAQIKDLI